MNVFRDDEDLQLTVEEMEDLVVVQTEKSNRYLTARKNRRRIVSVLLSLALLSLAVLVRFRGSNASDETDKSADWYKIHLDHEATVNQQFADWREKNADRIIAYNADDDNEEGDLLDTDTVVEEFRQVLANQSLVLIGDSTLRVLYASLWCMLEGLPSRGPACTNRQEELKAKCNDKDASKCETRAIFSDGFPAILEYVPYYHVGPDPDPSVTINWTEMMADENKVILVGIPCLHSLWSPGSRELFVRSFSPSWPVLYQEFFGKLEEDLPKDQWYLSLPVTVAEDKLGAEIELIRWYLQDRHFNSTDPKSKELVNYYNNGGQKHLLDENYNGPIPVLKPAHNNHAEDDALYDESGNKRCTLVGLEIGPKDVPIVDIKAVTANASEDTVDGRHYWSGQTLLKQFKLLMKVMKHHKQKRQQQQAQNEWHLM